MKITSELVEQPYLGKLTYDFTNSLSLTITTTNDFIVSTRQPGRQPWVWSWVRDSQLRYRNREFGELQGGGATYRSLARWAPLLRSWVPWVPRSWVPWVFRDRYRDRESCVLCDSHLVESWVSSLAVVAIVKSVSFAIALGVPVPKRIGWGWLWCCGV